jgi:hypothetical protein
VSEYLLIDERAVFCAVISAAVIASDASDFMIFPGFRAAMSSAAHQGRHYERMMVRNRRWVTTPARIERVSLSRG